MRKYIFYFSCIFFLSGLGACSDYLDTSKELTENLTINEVFENVSYTRRWHQNIYNCIIEHSKMGSSTATNNNAGANWVGAWNSNPWSAMSGEIMQNGAGTAPVRDLLESGFTTGSAQWHRWGTQYQQIRQAMIFLERAKPLGKPGDLTSISETELNKMKAEAKFFIAYCYFTLFELYGPPAIVPELANPENPNIDYPRASVDEIIELIDGLLQEVINTPELPESIYRSGVWNYTEMVRPTKVVAMALRARLAVYAASPLYNGGYAEALTLKNKDGKRLFPDHDANKWVIAKQRLEELLVFAEAQGHKLYYSADLDPHKSVYEIFQNGNDEIMWATDVNERNGSTNGDKRVTPRDIYGGWANYGPSQEVVDAFFMDNGLCIDDPGSGYRKDGFTDVFNPASSTGRTDPNIFNMFANREPRFYASVMYQGRSWHIQPGVANWAAGFAKGQPSGNSTLDSPRGGYLLYKFYSRNVNLSGSSSTTYYNKPSILFRLADFYLYYAEVCNEINPNDPNVIDYIDKIRDRAGIPGYRELQESGKKTGIIGNYKEQKEAIIHERYVELFAEGQRYFDMNRWMISEPGKSKYGDLKQFHGLNMNGLATEPIGSNNSFFTVIRLETRGAWSKKYYLFPIAQDEVNKSKGQLLIQNPLWEAVKIDSGTE